MSSTRRIMTQDLDADHEYDIAALNDEVDGQETGDWEEETMILIETNDSKGNYDESDSSTYSEKDKLLSLAISDSKAGTSRPVILGKKSHKPITIGSIVIEKVSAAEQSKKPEILHKAGTKNIAQKQEFETSTKTARSSKFTCYPCKLAFRTENELKAHRSQHVISKKYQCQICYMDSDNQMEFFEHLKTHYEPKVEEHTKSEASNDNMELQGSAAGWSDAEDTIEVTAEANDDEVQEKGKLFECSLCRRTFKSKRALSSHTKSHKTMTQYQCGTCSSVYDDLASLKKHMVETHLNEASTSQDQISFTIQDEEGVETEMTTENEYICELCGVVLTSQNDLKAHKKKEHKVKKGSKTELYCELCDRSFDYKTTFMYHMRNHTGERPHSCEVCGKGFRSSGALKVHMRIHTGEKPYQCQQCDRSFRQWGDLSYHMASIHSDVKNYKCEYCGKDFARKYSLIVHVRCHTGERNYECEYCHKRFRASTYLASHRRIHTGERPHICAICLKTFRMRSDMKRHLQMHGRDGADPAVLLAAVTDSEEMITPGKKRGPKQTHIVLSRGGKNGKTGELKIESMMSEEDRAIASLEGDEGEDLLLTIADPEAGAVGGDMEMIVGDDSNPYVVKDANNQVFVWSVFTPQQ